MEKNIHDLCNDISDEFNFSCDADIPTDLKLP